MSDFIDGETFHREVRQVYHGPSGWAINKRHAHMAKVLYEPAHQNLDYSDPARRGQGKDYATWIFSEEPGLQEGHFQTPFELMIDARLEPHASIGLHRHAQTEEVYYILEGTITMTTIGTDERQHTETLTVGDAHTVGLGQSHYGTAGPDGVRFLAVAVRAR
jgi:mannose-6-phosphate isomerase-like protein (cupin superfamily)